MASTQIEGNTQHGVPTEAREPQQRETESPRWAYRREPLTPEQERLVSMEVVSNGSMIAATGGFATVVLSILALSSLAPTYLPPIAAMALGIALLFEGGAVATWYWKLPDEVSSGRWASTELASGMVIEFLAGITGITLGIVALSGFASLLLTTIAVLVFGGALLFGSGLPARLNYLETPKEEKPAGTHRFGRMMTWYAAIVQAVVGAGVCILAILALVGIGTATLTSVALLALGGAVLFSGSAVTSRIMGLLHRC